ncbi:MAG: signal recognition particle-docking protein FtsY [Oscillospiraceae bacterium]|nr:signal recognition particle-docking protein FtsY [Oscillospiraceae bacterium]
MGFLEKLKSGIKKTSETITKNIEKVLNLDCKIDDEFFEALEEALIMSDVGVVTSQKISKELKKAAKSNKIENSTDLKPEFIRIITQILNTASQNSQPVFNNNLSKPNKVILVVGVNGVGKTTTIGKLAYNLKNAGQRVIVAAADTFRDAAVAQLEVWADRAGVFLVKNESTSDPSAVIYEAIKLAKTSECNVLICDTAGRLHNKKNLMAQLEKMKRIIDRFCPQTEVEILLVLDATTGQNAVAQAQEFKNVMEITGIILTKLDGTAKGGMVLSICDELGVPIKYVGLGEEISDLEPFEPEKFAQALFDFDV